ncbi:PREDICTED: lysophospholipid acyltransferase LPEAT2-like [Lupinus angustifolius]|uniref:lysophospholipid acyltransferase LPEAT2-like n=1 Tax=Lupinus angustifolius TaxID=3871 RepID=UPI00092FB727|nr:PREDICTED: lysophospholipid acyltransferase LPEAT2-like [Lupinus angustifolius]
MAENDITAPLLSSSDHLIITVESTSSTNQQSPQLNPFAFIGCGPVPEPPEPSTVDPFRNNTPRMEGVYEWVKMVACFPLAVVRLVLFALCLGIGFVATKLALHGWKDNKNPMPKWRSRVMWVTRLCARVILFSFGYQWIKRRGRPAPREIAPIIVSNHVSYIEPIFYFYELFATIVASESHDSLPFVGTIVRAMQVIYVDRFSASSRKQVVQEIKKRASCDRFPRVLLFPEGTTTSGRNLISFQLGAFIAGYPIQPVIVRYPHVHFDQSWGNISLTTLMFRMFTQFHNFFEVEYLPVISPLDDKETAEHFRERTAHAIATAMNGVQTGHSYGDLMLYNKAQESKKENPSSYMVEMASVESLFHIRSLEAVGFLDKFLAMNPDHSGRVQYDGFLRVFRLKDCPLSQKVFAFIDVKKSGTITFKQFLYGSAHVMTQPGFNQACEVAFAECGGAVNAYIVEQQLQYFIQHAIPGCKENEVHELFELFDNDNVGRINKDEFLSCLRRNPLLVAIFTPHQQHKEFGSNGVIEIL